LSYRTTYLTTCPKLTPQLEVSAHHKIANTNTANTKAKRRPESDTKQGTN